MTNDVDEPAPANGTCERCGCFEVVELDGHVICGECLHKCGSCCTEGEPADT